MGTQIGEQDPVVGGGLPGRGRDGEAEPLSPIGSIFLQSCPYQAGPLLPLGLRESPHKSVLLIILTFPIPAHLLKSALSLLFKEVPGTSSAYRILPSFESFGAFSLRIFTLDSTSFCLTDSWFCRWILCSQLDLNLQGDRPCPALPLGPSFLPAQTRHFLICMCSLKPLPLPSRKGGQQSSYLITLSSAGLGSGLSFPTLILIHPPDKRGKHLQVNCTLSPHDNG